MDINMPTTSDKKLKIAILLIMLLETTTGLLIPQSCATYSLKHFVNITHHQYGDCYGDISADTRFTITSSPANLKLNFPHKVDLRTVYLSCNSTDNKRIQLLYNGRISETIDLCPDLYPGYYYPQYFYLNADDVVNVNITLTLGSIMSAQSCIHDNNGDHDTGDRRISTSYPQGGVFPVRCSLRLWRQELPVKGTNIALHKNGAQCNYWRPNYGIGRGTYCLRILDGYVDPWHAPFAFSADTKAGLESAYIKVVFPFKKHVSAIAFIQHDHPKIRQFSVRDDSSQTKQVINSSLPLSKDQYMQWEMYSIGPYFTEYIVLTMEKVDFLPSDQMVVGLYEVEIYSTVPDINSTFTSTLSYTTSPPTTVSHQPQTNPQPTEDGGKHYRVIMIVVIVACIAGLSLLAIVAVFFIICRRKSGVNNTPTPGVENPGYSGAQFTNGNAVFVPEENAYATLNDKPPNYDQIYEKYDINTVANYDNAVKRDSYIAIGGVHKYQNDSGIYEKLQVVNKPEVESQYETFEGKL